MHDVLGVDDIGTAPLQLAVAPPRYDGQDEHSHAGCDQEDREEEDRQRQRYRQHGDRGQPPERGAGLDLDRADFRLGQRQLLLSLTSYRWPAAVPGSGPCRQPGLELTWSGEHAVTAQRKRRILYLINTNVRMIDGHPGSR